jgi:protein TorT
MRIFCAFVLSGLLLGELAAADWYPVTVQADGAQQSYQPLLQARQSWRICVLLPHGKDVYWWGVTWGLDQEANRQGVRLGIYEAGGYENQPVQLQQLQRCAERGADAYVIAAIDAHALCPAIAGLRAQGKPVIDLVNGIDCPGISASSRVNFADMTGAAMKYLRAHQPGDNYSLGWLPGPEGAGWVNDSEAGVQQALQGTSIRLHHAGYAPVDRSSQAFLVRALFREYPQLDYVLGNAEAAGFAAELVRTSSQHYSTLILASYMTDRIVEQVRDGAILAAPTDSPVLQARIAVDLAIRALEGRPHAQLVSPLIEMLDQQSLQHFDVSRMLPPEGYRMARRQLPL